jgi:hypothetical protein
MGFWIELKYPAKQGRDEIRSTQIGLFVVDAQIPPAVFGKTVEANEFIFLLCGRPVLAPCIALVEYKSSFVDELFGMLKCPSVKHHGHGCSPLRVATYRRAGLAEDGAP